MVKPVPRGRFQTQSHHSLQVLLSRMQNKAGLKRARGRLPVEESAAAAEGGEVEDTELLPGESTGVW